MRGKSKKRKSKQQNKLGLEDQISACLWSVSFTDFHTSLDSPDNFTQNNIINQIKNRPLDVEGEPISCHEWLKSATLQNSLAKSA